MFFNKKSAQGVGTLIIFIALILVAAIASAVIIQTSSSLQSKSLDTGRETQEKILSTIDVISVYGQDASDSILNQDDFFTVRLKLGPGSEPIDLTRVIISLDTEDFYQTYFFSDSASYESFNVTYMSSGGNYTVKDYLTKTDMIEVPLILNGEITTLKKVSIRITTVTGGDVPIMFTIPSALVQKRELFFP